MAYDLLGYGASERPTGRDTSVTAQADLLVRLLDTLGIEQVSLVAHDIGGAIAQIVAVANPERVRRMMLIDTVSYDSCPSATWRRIIDQHLDTYAAMSEGDFTAMLTQQLRDTVEHRMSDDVLATYREPNAGALGRASFFEHQVRHYDSAHTERIADRLGELRIPVRLLWGERDRWQPVSYAHRLVADIPTSDLAVVPGAGHFLPEDSPQEVIREVVGFLG